MFPPWWCNWPYLRRTYLEERYDPAWMYLFGWFRIWAGCGLAFFLLWVGAVLVRVR